VNVYVYVCVRKYMYVYMYVCVRGVNTMLRLSSSLHTCRKVCVNVRV